ncbi:MAG: AEC family transporter [Acidobacteria bacterium]|nr:AEC family transporter [Acidobacteriota bacterium]MDA1235660.1 AEC family transporter [Acidobacteriota bacterium]
MFAVCLNAVLPIFAVVVLGFAFGRGGLFDGPTASVINRFVFYAALPVLLFRLIATAPFEDFEWPLIAAYGCSEVILYAAGFLIARFGFGRSNKESLLLGMAAGFANHVFFVLPIAQQLYGEEAAVPVVGVITLDAVILFGGTVLILETMSDAARGLSPLRLLRLFARNPQILGITAGVAASIFSLPLNGGPDVFTKFLGASAAPCSLFALGVMLAAQTKTTSQGLPWALVALKLGAMPLVMWLLLTTVFQVSPDWSSPAMLVAAGPTGTMPFVLGLQYKAPVDVIATTIFLSTLGSLVTVTLMSQLA